MDPSTTLMTFMIQTSAETTSVHLVGSWDNFTKHYPMERDTRRAHGQWRGCYSFKDITCDGDSRDNAQISKRSGGLKMGHTYWYYYELDDGTEIHDPTLTSTTACPYLPGQRVNLLWVPVEVNPLRLRSASTSSVNGEYKTMNPADKFLKPRPPPATPLSLPRINTSPSFYESKSRATSMASPLPSPKTGRSLWSPRSLFGLRSPTNETTDRGRSSISSFQETISTPRVELSCMVKSGSGSSMRDDSPESLRRKLSTPISEHHAMPEHSISNSSASIAIPDDINEDDEDDDHNFAEEAEIEKIASTVLSPAPSRSRPTTAIHECKDKPLPSLPSEDDTSLFSVMSPTMTPKPLSLSQNSHLRIPRSHFSIDSISSEIDYPLGSATASTAPSVSEDDADLSPDDEASSPTSEHRRGFAGYSLPPTDYGSELTIRKQSPLEASSSSSLASPRMTFGPVMRSQQSSEPMSALEEFLTDLGYLGDAIQANN